MIQLSEGCFRYQDDWVLRNVDFEVNQWELLTLVGPSGCGKSTLLRILAGLEKLETGTIEIQGIPLKGIRKKTALLLQDLGLFPWKTVVENITFILEDRGLSNTEAHKKAMTHLTSVNMEAYCDRYPNSLSGGQRQRVGFAKAIALDPDLLLLDEATASLDAFASEGVQDILKTIHKETNITMILVTHKIDEAVYLGDKIAVMMDGTIKGVYDNPTVNLENQRSQIEFFNQCQFIKEAFKHEKIV